MIKQIFSEDDANKCDKLLKKLILDEVQYDSLVDENMDVQDYFCNVIKDERNILLGYYIDDTIVAYLYLKHINDDVCIIDGLYVLENYRNRKIATNLIYEAIDISKKRNYRYIDINVMYHNEKAKYIYKAFGFDEFKVSFRKSL